MLWIQLIATERFITISLPLQTHLIKNESIVEVVYCETAVWKLTKNYSDKKLH